MPWEADEAPLRSDAAVVDDTDLPTITLVTPCFNAVEFLEKTIRSVILQNYPKLQWIVMDGGSTDGTVEIIRYYEPFLSHWVSQPDSGQSDALNKGFAAATGDLLCWLNADDLFLRGALLAVARTWLENGRSDFIIADADLVNQDLSLITQQAYADVSAEALIDYRRNYLIQPGVFFSKRAWLACGPLSETLHYAMDFDLFYRMASRYTPVRCYTKVAHSVFHPDCKTVKNRVFSIIETALLQAKLGRLDIAERELVEVGKEHKFLEDHFHRGRGRRRVLFVISELGLGGAQTFLMRLLRDFSKQHDVFFYVYFKHTLSRQFSHLIPKDVTTLNEFDLGAPSVLAKFCKILNIEIVFSHLFHADQLCHDALRDSGTPLILTDHGDFKIADRFGLASFDQITDILRSAHSIIVTSEAGRESFGRFGTEVTEKLSLIPLGIDAPPPSVGRTATRRFLQVPEDRFVFACAARGVAEKGWAELYETFIQADAASERPLELWCFGSGPAVDDIKARAIVEGRINVRFFGFQRNVQSLIQAADCVVLLTKFMGETLNLSLMEALPLGLPSIATRIGAIHETVGEGPDAAGLLLRIDPHALSVSIDAAVSAMLRIAGDSELRATLSKAARRRAVNFDMSSVSARTMTLMEWAITTPRAASVREPA